eukprot:2525855-Rhodomonas_salina.1
MGTCWAFSASIARVSLVLRGTSKEVSIASASAILRCVDARSWIRIMFSNSCTVQSSRDCMRCRAATASTSLDPRSSTDASDATFSDISLRSLLSVCLSAAILLVGMRKTTH